MSKQSVSLYYSEGSSDKEYHVQLEPSGAGFVVNFQYGRRGSTLQMGTKTANPLPIEKAQKIYEKLVAEKRGKGYTEGEEGTPYAGTEMAGKVSGLVPQLLNAIGADRLQELLDDPAYVMQEKKDGVRLMVRYSWGEVVGSNRKGLVVGISSAIEAGVKELLGGGAAVLDGEAVGDLYHVFDLLEIDGEDLRTCGFEERWVRLQDLFGKREGGLVQIVPISRKPWHKRQTIGALQAAGAEGVVFKRWDAPYFDDQFKSKFVESATCVVGGVSDTKRSVSIQVANDSTDDVIDIGNVTIPANHEIPRPGDLVEVRYLYAYPGGSLYQPVYLGHRADKDTVDRIGSLKFKV